MDKDFAQKMIDALKSTEGKSMDEIEVSATKEALKMLELRKSLLRLADIEIGMSADGKEGFITSEKPARLREELLGNGLSDAFSLEINVRYSGKEVNQNKMRGLVAMQLIEIADVIKDRFSHALQFSAAMKAAEQRAQNDKSN